MQFPIKISSAAGHAAKALVLMSTVYLAGCSGNGAIIDDNYVSASPEERFPITVAEAPVKMNVSAKSGSLRAGDVNRVVSFAQDARSTASSIVTVRYASGSSHARGVAQQTVAVLVDQGVPRSMIRTGSYGGSASVVTLSFNRKVAVTKECGDWSQNLGSDNYNEPYPNQGCALQQNMAAMVANPEDFETPRAMSPAVGVTRSAAIKKYNAGTTINDTTTNTANTGSTTGSN